MIPAETPELLALVEALNHPDDEHRPALIETAAKTIADQLSRPPDVWATPTPLQACVWSNTTRTRGVEQPIRYTWQQWSREIEDKAKQMHRFVTMVADLSRGPDGTPGTNPHIRPGEPFAYNAAGEPYAMPEDAALRADPDAWLPPVE